MTQSDLDFGFSVDYTVIVINLRELVSDPGQKELSVLTEDQVQQAVVEQIGDALEITTQQRGLLESAWDSRRELALFDINSGKPQAVVYRNQSPFGLTDYDTCQRVAFAVMERNGLDDQQRKPKYTTGGFNSQGVTDDGGGKSREILVYPSQLHERLSFERTRIFPTGQPDKTIGIRWATIGQKIPILHR